VSVCLLFASWLISVVSLVALNVVRTMKVNNTFDFSFNVQLF
jgi:hypothetical protein